MLSGLTETDVIPHLTNLSVRSGKNDGACPHIDDVIPCLLAAVITLSKAHNTEGSLSSKDSSSFSLSLSTPSVNSVKSFDPMEIPFIPSFIN
mgnify:FL=1